MKMVIVYYKGTNGNGYKVCMKSMPMEKNICEEHLKRNGFFNNPVIPESYLPIHKEKSFVDCDFAQIEEYK